MKNSHFWRKTKSALASAASFVCALLVIAPLALVFLYLLRSGASAVNWSFFTELPKPVGVAGGGMVNAIAGSFELLGLAALVGIPVGVFGGVYLAEYGTVRGNWLLRFVADVLNGVPSIIWGVVVYGLVVLRFKSFSAYAGGLALGFIMIPLIMRTTEEVLLLVPAGYREASLALGISRWKTIVHIVMKTALKGIVTAILLALARVAGETAPLLFTAFGNRFWNHDLSEPIAALPLQIFSYAISPYDDWHRQAWAGALVLVVMIFFVNILVRFLTREKAIENVTLTIPSKMITAIIGPSGCGKSTLLRSLNRMHELVPQTRIEGRVVFAGEDIYAPHIDPVVVRRRIGMVFQKSNPFPTMSIAENVLVGLKLNGVRDRAFLRERLEESLRMAALWDEVKNDLQKPGISLSGGQQQRLCIARAIAVEPEVLLMDEPASALDPIATAKIEELIHELSSNYTVVIVTHNMQQAGRCSDYTAFLYLGRLIEFASTTKIFTNPSERQTEDYITGRFG